MPINPKHAGDAPKKEKNQPVEEIFIPEEPKWSLDDIILPESVKNQILDVATYADNAHRVFELWGFKRTHKFSRRIGINLYGAPRTGKTMAAHAIVKADKNGIVWILVVSPPRDRPIFGFPFF